MSKTTRTEPAIAVEDPRGNLPTFMKRAALEDDREQWDLLHYATRVAPSEWPAWVLKELGKRASVGPWRRCYGNGLADWGAVPGTEEGSAHRYYFSALRGRGYFDGTVVATSARAVEVWLRDQERAEGSASRDVRRIAGPGA